MILFYVAPGFKDQADTWQTIGGAVVAIGGAIIMIRKGVKSVTRGFARAFDAGVDRTLKPALDEIKATQLANSSRSTEQHDAQNLILAKHQQAMAEGFSEVNDRLDEHTKQIARLEGIRDPESRDRKEDRR